MADLNAWNGIGPRDDTSPVASYAWWHAKYYFAPIIVVVALYLVALATAKQFAIHGSYGGIGGIMLGLQFVILLVGFMWGNIGLAAILGYIRGQAGGLKENKEEGLSIEDGIKGAQEWSIGFKNFWLGTAHFAAIPFLTLMLLAWAGPESVQMYSGTLLTLSFAALIAVSWLSTGRFVASLFMVIEVIALVALLGFIVKEGVDKRLTIAQAASAAQRTADEKARDDAKAEVTQVIRNTRKTCYDDLAKRAKNEGKIAPNAEFDKCAAIGVETTPVVSAPAISTAANDGAVSSTAPAAAAPAGAVSATATSATVCDQVVKAVDYTPSEQPGAVDIGSLPAGRYEVTATGKRRQMFFAGTAMDPVPSQLCEMDPFGRIGFCWNPDGQKVVRNMNGQPWFAPPNVPGSEPLLITEGSVPYGGTSPKPSSSSTIEAAFSRRYCVPRGMPGGSSCSTGCSPAAGLKTTLMPFLSLIT
jgi:hypothetical protein